MKENLKLTPFTFLKGMTENKEKFDFSLYEVKKSYNQFLLNKYLGSVQIFLPLVNVINRMGTISDEMHYEFFFSKLPKRKFYFKYFAKEKELDSNEIDCISRYFEISKREAKMYIKILSVKIINEIVVKFNHGVNV